MKKTCGCCEGIEKLTPMVIANRPGLNALAYRAGTHAGFLDTMKARLTNYFLDIPRDSLDENGHPQFDRLYPLQKLTTHAVDDPTIALLEAWATVGAVLTFYQERFANEGFLRTATERRSILELARLVGYSLRPGVAATVYLAYTLDNNFKDEVIIPAGARSQSVPGPDELPQTFETAEPLPARAAWNNLRPRQTQPQTVDSIKNVSPNGSSAPRVYLKGISTNLKPNDPLLIDFGNGSPKLFRVLKVDPDAAADRTLVTLQAWTSSAATRTARVAETVKEIVERFSEVEQFNVSRTAELTKRVLGHLQDLQAQIVSAPSEAKLVEFMEQDTLPKLTDEHRLAKERQSTKLEPWLGQMIAKLDEAKQQAAAVMAREVPVNVTTSGGKDVDPFSQTLKQLVLPASVPPANKLKLQRSFSREFVQKADAGLQLLTAFQPKLNLWLPIAVANAKVTLDSSIKVYALRVKATPFGSGTPKKVLSIDRTTGEITATGEWPIVENAKTMHEEPGILYLDASYDKISPDSWVVIDTSSVPRFNASAVQVQPASPANAPLLVTTVDHVQADISRAEYGMSGKTTRLKLDNDWLKITPLKKDEIPPIGIRAAVVDPNQPVHDNDFKVLRLTSVYAQSELLELAEEPIDTPICGGATSDIELDGLYNGLQSGRWLIVAGERTDVRDAAGNTIAGVKASELVMLSSLTQGVKQIELNVGEKAIMIDLPGDKTHTFIRLSDDLAYCYKRDTVTIYGNVAKATHGETRQETLGSGDGSKAWPTFPLRQPPLTYIAASTPAGAESTLKMYVNDVQWHEAESFAALAPTDRNFITRTDDAGKTALTFGNGERGARLPTGIENVKAVYRNGIGKPGNVKAEQISLLTTRPLGVKEVINPLPASGGADKESRDQARRNVPVAVAALDRLVSTQDYADFARSFAGIGKASAVRLSDGRRQIVHLTIAGADDIPIDKTSDLYRNLFQALHEFGDPFQPLQVEVRELAFLAISANVRLLPDYLWEAVAPKIRQTLLDTFSFGLRELGQDVVLSEVISAIQSIAGVAYVDVDTFRGVPEAMADEDDPGQRRLLTPSEILEKINLPLTDAQGNILREPLARVAVNMAGFERGAIHPAQLAYLTPAVEATLILNEVK